jgi:hypothetical protein
MRILQTFQAKESYKGISVVDIIEPIPLLEPSFPRRRESSKKNNPSSGQNPEVDLLRRSFFMTGFPPTRDNQPLAILLA